jgi:hypothetical protein
MVPVATQARPELGYATHHGFTIEYELAFELTHGSGVTSNAAQNGIGIGIGLGLGGWLSLKTALTLRLSTVGSGFLGPALQHWPYPHVWIGGGAGISTHCTSFGYESIFSGSCRESETGFAVEGRAGYAFGASHHTFNASVEGTSGFVTGVAFLLGCQCL